LLLLTVKVQNLILLLLPLNLHNVHWKWIVFSLQLKPLMALQTNIFGLIDQNKLIVTKPLCWRFDVSRKCNLLLFVFESTKQ
jgi:hypothetical protein